MARPAPKPTKTECKIIRKHYLAPKTFTRLAAMKALGLGYNYNGFHDLFYRCMIEQA